MKYTIDLEFLEHGNAWGGEITPISIAVVREDGAYYYAENGQFSWDDARKWNSWLIDNVQPYLLGGKTVKNPLIIKKELDEFLSVTNDPHPEFWGYYADYDWVSFCWHWGAMVQLPKHFPIFCRDIKQVMAERGLKRDDMPAQEGTTHNALDDARWMQDALKFLEIT